MTTATDVQLDIHGLVVRLTGDWPEVIESTAQDFGWFATGARGNRCDLTIRVDRRPAEFDPAADIRAAKISPRSVTYRLPSGAVLTDYLGLASSHAESDGTRVTVAGPDPSLAEEIVSNTIRAALVRQLDRTDRLGVHALGLAGPQGAVLVMLPAGGGKSSLAMQALRHPGVKILSDDMPILDRDGVVHPHPVRIGVTVGDPAQVDLEGRSIERLGWRPKTAVEIDSLGDRVQDQPVPLAHLVVGTRNLGERSELTPTESARIWRLLFQESVLRVDSGTSVAWATSRRRVGPTMRKIPRVARRVTLCRSAVGDARTWRLALGSDREGCWEAIAPLFEPAVSSAGAAR